MSLDVPVANTVSGYTRRSFCFCPTLIISGLPPKFLYCAEYLASVFTLLWVLNVCFAIFDLKVPNELFPVRLIRAICDAYGAIYATNIMLVFPATREQPDCNLRGSTPSYTGKNIELKRAKIDSHKHEGDYHGHVSSSKGLKPDP